MMIRAPLIFVAIIGLSASAFAQTAVPKAGAKAAQAAAGRNGL
jgi:hypothetical protein